MTSQPLTGPSNPPRSDEFVQNTMQELVDDTGVIRVQPNVQHTTEWKEEKVSEGGGGVQV